MGTRTSVAARTALLVAALTLSTTVVCEAAGAVSWRSASSPLVVKEHGKVQGKAYGRFFNDGSVNARSTTYQYDARPGGNKVRVETDFWFREWATECEGYRGGICWVEDVSKQTRTTNSASWVRDSRARHLHNAGDAVRGAIDVCEIQAWHNDPCSRHAVPTFGY